MAKLSEMLGVKFYKLQPKVATIVLSLPFEVNLALLHRYHDEDLVVVRQGHRIKVAAKRWTMLVYPRTATIYTGLRTSNPEQEIELVLLQCTPLLCRYPTSLPL